MRLIRQLLPCLALVFGSVGQAATYYVREGGNDAADGRSHATAWETIEKLNATSFSAGDEILFHEGDTWSGRQLVVSASGDTSAHTVVGAYYVENGAEVRGVRAQRPKITGANRVPDDRYAGLVEVTGDYVRIENLALSDSRGRGVSLRGADFGQVVNVTTRNTYDSGIKLNESSDGLVENSFVTDSNRAFLAGARTWGSALVGVESPRLTVRGNTVAKVYGEGINANHGSHDALIEGNRVFGARAVGIYVDSSRGVTIRRNMVLGTSDDSYWRAGRTVGSGIVVNNEKYHYAGNGGSMSKAVQATDVKIYANLVAYTQQGIAFWGNLPESSFDRAHVYNNTLVDNSIQFDAGRQPKPDSRFANNILLSLSAGAHDVDEIALLGMTAGNNYLSQGDPGGDFSHPANVYGGLELVRMRGWRSIEHLLSVSWLDFAPLAHAVAGAGDPAVLSLASGADQFDHDFSAKAHNRPIDIGAIRFGASNVPAPPGAVSVRGKSR